MGTSKWEKLSLVNDKDVIKLKKADVYVFSDSCIVCWNGARLSTLNDDWRSRLRWFKSTQQYRESDGIDGEPVEFEWGICPGHTTLQILQEIQVLMRAPHAHPEQGAWLQSVVL